MPRLLNYLLLLSGLLVLKANLAVPPYLIGQLINAVSDMSTINTTTRWLSYLLLSTLLTLTLSPLFTYFFEQAIQRNVETQSKTLFAQLLSKPFAHFKRLEIGALASQFDRGIASYEQYINLCVSRGLPLIIEGLVLTGALLMMCGATTVLMVFALLSLAAVVKMHIVQRRRPHLRRVNEAEDAILEQVVAAFSGIRTIQSNRVSRFFERRLAPYFERYRQATVSLAVSRSVFDGVAATTMSVMSLAIMVLFVGYLLPNQQANTGTLVTAMLLSTQLTRTFIGLLDVYRLLDQSREDFSALKAVLAHVESSSKPSPLLPLVLKALSEPSVRTVAIVGPSGRGKTVLLDTLSGLLTPLPMYPHSVNYLEQSNFVFSGTVYDNLTLGQKIDRHELAAQLQRVGLSSRLTLDTVIMGNGENLSGGEKRRLCFLRAYLHTPSLLLLDEPTSGLDARTASEIWDMMFKLLPNSSKMVAVTHDTSSLVRFDRVIRL